MSIDWCRLWHDMPNDPKFRAVAKRSGRPTAEVLALFTAMLTNASANEDDRGTLRNWSHEDMGVALDIEPEHAEAIFNAMQGKLLDGDRLTGWERRQPKREDNSAERVRAHRERKREQSDAAVTTRNALVTQCNAQESEKEKEKEKEEQSVSHSPEPAREIGQTDDPNFEKCKLAFNGSTIRLIDEIKNSEGPYGTKARAASWLADTLDDFGADAILDAFRFLEKCRGEGQSIRDPKGFLSKSAQRYRENQVARKQEKATKVLSDAEKRAKGMRRALSRMTGEIIWVS